MRGWILLLIAVTLEVTETSILNTSDGFRCVFPAIAALTIYFLSFFIFARALQYIPLGLAYAIWSGLGIIIVCFIGVLAFKQNLSLWSYIGISLIILGTSISYIFGNAEKIQL